MYMYMYMYIYVQKQKKILVFTDAAFIWSKQINK